MTLLIALFFGMYPIHSVVEPASEPRKTRSLKVPIAVAMVESLRRSGSKVGQGVGNLREMHSKSLSRRGAL